MLVHNQQAVMGVYIFNYTLLLFWGLSCVAVEVAAGSSSQFTAVFTATLGLGVGVASAIAHLSIAYPCWTQSSATGDTSQVCGRSYPQAATPAATPWNDSMSNLHSAALYLPGKLSSSSRTCAPVCLPTTSTTYFEFCGTACRLSASDPYAIATPLSLPPSPCNTTWGAFTAHNLVSPPSDPPKAAKRAEAPTGQHRSASL